MEHFTAKQIEYISTELYNWISGIQDDELYKKNGMLDLLSIGLSRVTYKTNRAGFIKESDLNVLLPRLILILNSIGRIEGDDSAYYTMPYNKRVEIYNSVIYDLNKSGTILSSIVQHCPFGPACHDNLIVSSADKKHKNEIRRMNCGQAAKIIAAFSGQITLQFEDGTIVQNKRYDDFKKGQIMNPTLMDLSGYHFGEF